MKTEPRLADAMQVDGTKAARKGLTNFLSSSVQAVTVGGEASEVPALPGLNILGEAISLPLMPGNTSLVMRDSPSLSRVFKEGEFQFTNPRWTEKIGVLAQTAVSTLCCTRTDHADKIWPIRILPHRLFLQGCGIATDFGCDITESEMFAVLLVQLPSIFTGGNIVVQPNDDFLVEYDLGQKNGMSAHACHYVANFCDVKYRVQEVASGLRFVAAFKICWTEEASPEVVAACSGKVASAAVGAEFVEDCRRLEVWVGELRKNGREAVPDSLFCIPLEQEYTLGDGASVFRGQDKAMLEALQRANQNLKVENQIRISLVHAEKRVVHVESDDENEAEISWSWYSEEGETREIDMYQYDLTELVPSPDANIPFWRERTQDKLSLSSSFVRSAIVFWPLFLECHVLMHGGGSFSCGIGNLENMPPELKVEALEQILDAWASDSAMFDLECFHGLLSNLLQTSQPYPDNLVRKVLVRLLSTSEAGGPYDSEAVTLLFRLAEKHKKILDAHEIMMGIFRKWASSDEIDAEAIVTLLDESCSEDFSEELAATTLDLVSSMHFPSLGKEITHLLTASICRFLERFSWGPHSEKILLMLENYHPSLRFQLAVQFYRRNMVEQADRILEKERESMLDGVGEVFANVFILTIAMSTRDGGDTYQKLLERAAGAVSGTEAAVALVELGTCLILAVLEETESRDAPFEKFLMPLFSLLSLKSLWTITSLSSAEKFYPVLVSVVQTYTWDVAGSAMNDVVANWNCAQKTQLALLFCEHELHSAALSLFDRALSQKTSLSQFELDGLFSLSTRLSDIGGDTKPFLRLVETLRRYVLFDPKMTNPCALLSGATKLESTLQISQYLQPFLRILDIQEFWQSQKISAAAVPILSALIGKHTWDTVANEVTSILMHWGLGSVCDLVQSLLDSNQVEAAVASFQCIFSLLGGCGAGASTDFVRAHRLSLVLAGTLAGENAAPHLRILHFVPTIVPIVRDLGASLLSTTLADTANYPPYSLFVQPLLRCLPGSMQVSTKFISLIVETIKRYSWAATEFDITLMLRSWSLQAILTLVKSLIESSLLEESTSVCLSTAVRFIPCCSTDEVISCIQHSLALAVRSGSSSVFLNVLDLLQTRKDQDLPAGLLEAILRHPDIPQSAKYSDFLSPLLNSVSYPAFWRSYKTPDAATTQRTRFCECLKTVMERHSWNQQLAIDVQRLQRVWDATTTLCVVELLVQSGSVEAAESVLSRLQLHQLSSCSGSDFLKAARLALTLSTLSSDCGKLFLDLLRNGGTQKVLSQPDVPNSLLTIALDHEAVKNAPFAKFLAPTLSMLGIARNQKFVTSSIASNLLRIVQNYGWSVCSSRVMALFDTSIAAESALQIALEFSSKRRQEQIHLLIMSKVLDNADLPLKSASIQLVISVVKLCLNDDVPFDMLKRFCRCPYILDRKDIKALVASLLVAPASRRRDFAFWTVGQAYLQSLIQKTAAPPAFSWKMVCPNGVESIHRELRWFFEGDTESIQLTGFGSIRTARATHAELQSLVTSVDIQSGGSGSGSWVLLVKNRKHFADRVQEFKTLVKEKEELERQLSTLGLIESSESEVEDSDGEHEVEDSDGEDEAAKDAQESGLKRGTPPSNADQDQIGKKARTDT